MGADATRVVKDPVGTVLVLDNTNGGCGIMDSEDSRDCGSGVLLSIEPSADPSESTFQKTICAREKRDKKSFGITCYTKKFVAPKF